VYARVDEEVVYVVGRGDVNKPELLDVSPFSSSDTLSLSLGLVI